MEAGKKRLNDDVIREARSDEVSDLKKENARLKEMVADLVLRYDIVKKTWTCWINSSIQKIHEIINKYEIIQAVTISEIGVKRILESFGIARSTFYKWYQKYFENGYDGLETSNRRSKRQWNSIPEEQKDLVVQIALEHT